MTTGAPNRLIVAVNGSPESASALRWASSEAKRTGLALQIVTAYQPAQGMTDAAGAIWNDAIEAARSAKVAARMTITEVLGDDTDYEHVVDCGPIEGLLQKHCQGATMIVIGTRRKHTWYHELRRSVTNRVTGSVTCPVVSIPLPAMELATNSASNRVV